MISIWRIPNILDAANRSKDEVQFRDSRLSSYLRPEELSGDMRILVSHHGEVKPEAFDSFKIHDGAEVIVTPAVKDPVTLSAAATVAFTAAATLPVPALVGTALYGVGVAAAIGSAVQSFRGPKLSATKSGVLDDSPTYSWDGIQNQAASGVPVPIIYGRHRTGGNFINAYVENWEGYSYLNVLIALSEGPVQAIGGITKEAYEQYRTGTNSDGSTYEGTYAEAGFGSRHRNHLAVALCEAIGDGILIDGNPISDFVTPADNAPVVKLRYGHNPQDPVPGFDESHTFRSLNVQLLYGVPQVFSMETSDATDIQLLFELPALFKVADGGGFSKTGIGFSVFWKPYGADDSEYVLDGSVYEERETNAPVRLQYRIRGLNPGRYTVKIEKTVPDSDSKRQRDLYLKGIDEIGRGGYTYPYTALLGLRIRATSRLRGGLPNITTMVDGRIVETWDPDASGGGQWVSQWSRNPIWCLYDLVRNRRYGVGDHVEQDALDRVIDRWKSAAAICDEEIAIYGAEAAGQTEPRYELDIVLDGRMSATDMIMMICATCQAMIIPSAGGYYPVIDEAQEPTQIFGMGNIIRGSFAESCASLRATPNLIEVQHHDADNDYERDSLEIADHEGLDAGQPLRRATSFFAGVTRRSQALRLGAWQLKDAKYNIRMASWRAGIDAIGCQAGDVIGLSHDVPQWGESGRVASATSTTVVLNRQITLPTLASGESHLIQVRHAADDTIEERVITDGAGTYPAGTTLTVSPAWTATPAAYDVFAVGILPVKPFRVISMTRESSSEVRIQAVEHNPEVYDLSDVMVPPPNYSTLPNPQRVPPSVIDLTLTNTSAYNRTILAGWRLPTNWPETGIDEGFVDHYEVWTSLDGSSFEKAGETDASTFLITETIPGRTYTVRVLTVSRWGIKTPLETAPEASIVARVGIPPDVRGLQLEGRPNEHTFEEQSPAFEWKEASISARAFDPFTDSNVGAGAGMPDPYFAGYRVEIWSYEVEGDTSSRSIQRRVEIVQDPRYVYTIEKNREDHGGVPRRHFSIAVLAMDTYNQFSTNYATLPVTNKIPEAISRVVIQKVYKQLEAAGAYKWVHNRVSWSHHKDPDIKYYRVVRSITFYESNSTDLSHLEAERIIYDELGTALYYVVGEVANNYIEDSTPLGPEAIAYYVAAIDQFAKAPVWSEVVGSGIQVTDGESNYNADDVVEILTVQIPF